MILVTGGSGYLGSHIVRKLADAGKRVRVMVYSRERAELEGRLSGLPIEWVEADVTRPETLGSALEGVQTVIHTIAVAIEKGRSTYESINFQGTVNLVDAATEQDIQRFINISQLGASPDLPYRFLASKGRAQAYVAQSSLDWLSGGRKMNLPIPLPGWSPFRRSSIPSSEGSQLALSPSGLKMSPPAYSRRSTTLRRSIKNTNWVVLRF
jgi:uncharacterized protein YbjT (DUF2867 family)